MDVLKLLEDIIKTIYPPIRNTLISSREINEIIDISTDEIIKSLSKNIKNELKEIFTDYGMVIYIKSIIYKIEMGEWVFLIFLKMIN